MSNRIPNSSLKALLAETGWSAGELARAVNAQGNLRGLRLRYDRTAVAHWLTGTYPRPPAAELAAAAFTERLDRYITPEDTGLLAVHRTASPTGAKTGGHSQEEGTVPLQLDELCRKDLNSEHRTFALQAAYTLTAPTLPHWPRPEPLRPPSRITAPAGRPARNPGPAASQDDVAAMQETVSFFATACQRHGGGHARTALAAYLADDVTILLRTPAPPSLRSALQTAAAQLAHVLADMTDDTGRTGLSQTYYRHGLELARQAGDRSQYAITLRALSTQALRLQHQNHSHRLAEAALITAHPHCAPAVSAYLLAQHALTSARRGEAHRALADLHSAEQHHERAASPAGPFTVYSRASLDYARADTLEALGQHRQAHQALESSLRHRTPAEQRATALTHARLAELLLDVGHLDAACIHWNHFLDRYPRHYSQPAHQAVARIRRSLSPHKRHQGAASILERTHGLTPR
ncbi:tol-pal system YbgF family protein [Streptomyces buecherae]|uniref:tetratricopeptide repeat protein n=1 Tax=Streptomyces buecherae TaxID=2763006 RepID=UPI0036B5A957